MSLPLINTFPEVGKKRFSIAAAMMGDPDNFLFDETLNGLDPDFVNKRQIFDIYGVKICLGFFNDAYYA